MEKIQVLIAEDDFRIAQIHEGFLAQVKGTNCVGKAMNAQETMTLLDKHSVDLLLLDIYMPDRLGTDLLMEIREKHPEVDIILVTAAKEKEHVMKALKFGVQQFLIKPVTMETFVETLENYKKTKQFLDGLTEVDQEAVNRVFKIRKETETREQLPAGIDYLTLKKVSEILSEEKSGLTADKVGEKMGASRTTARRYLEYLVKTGEATVEQAYGVVGRPERNYQING
ncbi:response regulator [Mesobacillus maritimus]|uniref:response regulator n=1 Tax=Mesobacillus maritimus TaxID=1643336 RepID=UPI0020421A90|nr:response regulator [Mesobacillus maritimus]MCM3584857.1 response regulator [Mesobacillus maritimus]MCM3671270.1 response regulator [Mesobacillus maritimus]